MKTSIRRHKFFIFLIIILLMFNQFNFVVAATTNPSIIWVEAPTQNQAVTSDIKIIGWSLDASGVKEVNIFLDGQPIGKATIGLSRLDVNKAFPGYPGGDKSGFEYSLNLSNITQGTHIIIAESVGVNGTKVQQSVKIIVDKLKPITWIEAPSQNQTITNDIKIIGWALNSSGIKEVNILVDGQPVGKATIGLSRSDVDKAFPGYVGGDKSGFEYSINIGNISQGLHTIIAEAAGVNGIKTQQSVRVNIDKLKPITWIEAPSQNETIKSNYKIVGWALNSTGVKEINILIDGKITGKATTGIDRPDVNKVFPGYLGGDKSGFEYLLDIDGLSQGVHTIIAEAIGNNGTKTQQSVSININKLKPIIWIESPISNVTIKDNFKIIGWSLNPSGVKEVNIFLDGQPIGKATVGLSRLDVDKIFPGYPGGANSGFEYQLNVSTLPIGSHNILVQSIGNDNTTVSSQIIINMQGLVSYIQYDHSLSYYIDRQFRNGTNVIFGSDQQVTRDNLKYYMTPNNFINSDTGKYMFLKLSYVDGITAENLNQLLEGKGILDGKGSVFLEAAKANNINANYLVAHALHETDLGRSALANGIVVTELHKKVKNPDGTTTIVLDKVLDTPQITYNVYGVGAEDDNANMWGSEFAYRQNWFTIDDAIKGGAAFIANEYISNTQYKQDSLYKMKWNFNDGQLWHEYATDIGWAQKQTNNIKSLFDEITNPILNFEIPVFKPTTIVLDPGHGGTDTGAIGPTNLFEKDINLAIALKVGEILKNNNINVVYTRTKDANVTLQDRVNISNNANADYFISIHTNSYKDSERDVKTGSDLPTNANGIETYYYGSNKVGENLAQNIQNELVPTMAVNDMGLNTNVGNLYIINNTRATSILTEVGFITNKDQETAFRNEQYIQACAEAIARGLLKFVY